MTLVQGDGITVLPRLPMKEPEPMSVYAIHGFTYQMRERVLPGLASALSGCGAWVLEQRQASAGATVFVIELHGSVLVETYAVLAAAGVELSRAAQYVLAALCAARRQQSLGLGGGLIRLELEVRFLEDAPLSAVLGTGRGVS
jgi:hypothetical protein